MAERHVMTLAEAGVTLIDCVHKTPAAQTAGFPYVAIPQIQDGHLHFASARRISESDFAEWTRKALPQPHDVVLSRRCNPGMTAAVKDGDRFALGQNLVLLRADGSRVYPPFLRWLVRGQDWWNEISRFLNVGAVFDSLRCADVPKFQLPIPPLDEQRAIAGVLGALDDKIEQNRRTARALERLARAIFRAWFVDFEPVKAKAAGATSFPSMPQPVFDTLPTRLINSPLGPIPEGWEVGRLGDYCGVNEQSVRKGEIEGEIEYVDISSVQVGRLEGVQHVPFTDAPSRARRRVRHGDTIWSCVRPNHRSYLFIHTPPRHRIVSTGFAVLTPKAIGRSYLYQLVTQPEFVDYLVSNADGSAYPAVRPDHFAEATVVVAPQPLRDSFDALTMPFLDLIEAARRASSTLAQLRDPLLPKLLSGRVRVRSGEACAADMPERVA